MSEFLLPSYREWLKEYQLWPWDDYDHARWDPSTIFSHASPILRDVLSLPAQRDYYRPERAALFLETLYEQPVPLKHGMCAFATWMVKQKRVHLPTSLMGAEICRGMHGLNKELGIPSGVNEKLEGLLKEHDYSSPFEPSAQAIFVGWLANTSGDPPLATWLREKA